MAGVEAAWQIAGQGIPVTLYEMRPRTKTAIHRTKQFAELVCSNSLRSNHLSTAHGLLKEEMRLLGSLILKEADECRVPAGQALAVDRDAFAKAVTTSIKASSLIRVVREEITDIPSNGIVIVATGPLTSPSLSKSIAKFTGYNHLYFYDALSPVIDVETIDHSITFRASRYGKGGNDYINCPMNRKEYQLFYDALIDASTVDLHEIDKTDGIPYFEGCLPIEVMAKRGVDTLRFGPMKPVGLVDPRTQNEPYAVVQLRQDDLAATLYNIVGFQNQLKWSEQKRILRMIPGLAEAEIVRFGMIHRNTYINSPKILFPSLQTQIRKNLFFAGQLAGVEGYTESAASGLIAGKNAAALSVGKPIPILPKETAIGSLCHYIAHAKQKDYQPTNISFGLLPPLVTPIKNRRLRKEAMVSRSLTKLNQFIASNN